MNFTFSRNNYKNTMSLKKMNNPIKVGQSGKNC